MNEQDYHYTEAYAKGQQASEEYQARGCTEQAYVELRNPYQEKTKDWENWNRGWNSVAF